jgi:hypothetical protein
VALLLAPLVKDQTSGGGIRAQHAWTSAQIVRLKHRSLHVAMG